MEVFQFHHWNNEQRPVDGFTAARAIAVDTLVSGVHFPPQTPGHATGYKAIAVNLSDMAAMGAIPQRALVSVLIPPTDEPIATAIYSGCETIASAFDIKLDYAKFKAQILAITVEIHGRAEYSTALRRSGAHIGDTIYVSGSLGDAAAGLGILQGRIHSSTDDKEQLVARLEYPTPRVELGRSLLGVANSAIDISDGLCQDLSHLLHASGVGARIELDRIPLSAALIRTCGEQTARDLALTAGDDYELCFTTAPSKAAVVNAIATRLDCALHRIGRIVNPGKTVLTDTHGVAINAAGFDHFGSEAPRKTQQSDIRDPLR